MLVAIVIAAILLLTACPSAEQPTATAPKYVTVVGITALSGNAAAWGIPMSQLWGVVCDEINNNGGITVNGQQYLWKYKEYDHEMDPSKALEAANRAIAMDNAISLQVLDNDCVKSIQAVSEPKKVLLWLFGTPEEGIINTNSPHTFAYDIDCAVTVLLYPWLEKNTDVRKIAAFEPDTSGGHITNFFSEWAVQHACTEMELVYEGVADPATTDFYASLSSILAKEPDLIDVSMWDPGINALIIKQSRELGYNGGFHIVAPDFPTLHEVAGWQNCENVYLSPAIIQENDTMLKFKADFIAKYGEKNWIGATAYMNYDQIHWVTQAIKDTQSFDGDVIADYIGKMTTSSIWGSPSYFGGVPLFGIARIPLHPYYGGVIKNGEVVQTINGEYAEALR
jgi:ABC-type branched-subunit amino acid transport system substrate-binding protein